MIRRNTRLWENDSNNPPDDAIPDVELEESILAPLSLQSKVPPLSRLTCSLVTVELRVMIHKGYGCCNNSLLPATQTFLGEVNPIF
jgi:hypothetical protein